MCVNKLRVLNKGYNPLDMLSTKYIEVPCGKCWQCRIQRANGLVFRVLSELKQGVTPFFVTLTYNNTYRPVLDYYDVDSDGELCVKSLSVWNRQHLKKFHKVLRRQLQYYFGLDSSAFKYLVTCERGSNDEYVDNHGHKRIAQAVPHYHCIYLLYSSDVKPIRDLPASFIKYCCHNTLSTNLVSFFKFLLHNRWYYGLVDDIAFCRDVAACVRYVCKYIMKDYGEQVFKIDIKDIISLHDKSFDEANRHWIDSGKYIGDDDCMIPCYEYSRKAPSPVYFSELLPRPIVSKNLGIDFIADKDINELSNLLIGKQKVSLTGVKSCSLISIPSYYYRKLCYTTSKLHLNRWYSRNSNTPNSFTSGCVFTAEKYSVRPRWSNAFGCECYVSYSSYSVSEISNFGKYIRRVSFLNRYKQVKTFLNNVCINSDFYLSLFRTYLSLPFSLRSCVQGVQESFVSSLSNISLSISLRDFLLFGRDQSDQRVTNLINFMKLCDFTSAHLQHVAFEKAYNNKLCSSAFDNPDLFMQHYL